MNLLVLRQCPLGRVRLVEEGDPETRDRAILEEHAELVREPVHVVHRELERAALPGDVDVGSRAIRQAHRLLEGAQTISVRPGRGVEEDANELRIERDDLRLDAVEPWRRPADLGIQVLVQLPPKPPKLPTMPRVGSSVNSGVLGDWLPVAAAGVAPMAASVTTTRTRRATARVCALETPRRAFRDDLLDMQAPPSLYL